MTQRQINRLQMMQATHAYLDQNTSIWNSIPAIVRYKTELNSLLSEIKQLALEQEASRVYIGGSLQEMKDQLALKMDILDDALEAYAADTNNVELMVQASNSKDRYVRLPHEEFETKVKMMLELLEQHVPDMADYGLLPEQLDDVRQGFDDFLQKRGKPRAYRIASRIATQSLAELFDAASQTLDRLDNVLKRFKRSNPSFYTGYQAARMIVDH
jgi:predicted DNA-binding protein